MNFFEHQDWARRRTVLLVVLFVVAVVLVIVVANIAVLVVLGATGSDGLSSLGGARDGQRWTLFVVVAIGVVGLVAGASGFKVLSLRKGGGAVAEMLGGRLVNHLTDSPDERRLLNVVEEMAIASGTPVPEVYVLDNEPGINAFAAGHGVEDAAVTVTRGALEQFTRDELQGVIAHEFSHILNRDVRLNTRLTGLIFGILVLSVAGRILLRGGAYSRIGRSNKGGGAGAAVAVGLVLVIVGYIGVFFGRLIKQAVSRQREFLADASAVQFTRNPDGLANALKRIGQWSNGSVVEAPAAEEVSHFFFADGMRASLFGGLLSSHPPLDERIRRLDPSFTAVQGPSPSITQADRHVAGVASAHSQAAAGAAGLHPGTTPAGAGRQVVSGLNPTDRVSSAPASVVSSVGTTAPDRFVYDDIMELEIPQKLRDKLTSAFGGVAVLFGLLLDENEVGRRHQLAILGGFLQKPMIDEIESIYPTIRSLDRFARLPALDLAMPAIRSVSIQQYDQLLRAINAVIEADQHLSLHEYAIRSIVINRLSRHFGRARSGRTGARSAISSDVATVLSGLARMGHDSDREVQHAYSQAAERLAPQMVVPPTPGEPTARQIDEAVSRLSGLPLRRKQAVVDACAHSVLADENVNLEEAELLRVVIVALGCPLPPFLPTLAAG